MGKSVISGRRFTARFIDQQSRDVFFTMSAAQMLVYTAKAQEFQYHLAFEQKFLSPVRMPKPDQGYSHLINPQTHSWIAEVPGAVRGIGAYLFYRAADRFPHGLGRPPKPKKIKGADRSLMLTCQFFRIDRLNKDWLLLSLIKSKDGKTVIMGQIKVRSHRDYEMPAMVVIRSTNRSLTVSFCQKEELDHYVETQKEIAARLEHCSEAELTAHSYAYDWGVKIRVQGSDGVAHDLSDKQKGRIARKEKGIKKLSRRLARTKEGSRNAAKLKKRLSKKHEYRTNVNHDFNHQTSHLIAERDDVWIVGMEKLRVRNMTRRPKPKYDGKGTPLPNGAAAKAGLNKRILEGMPGELRRCVTYKCERSGKLVVAVDPKNSSRECAVCGHTSKKNRPSQAVFRCTSTGCGHECNADYNAALVLRKRAVQAVISGKVFSDKKEKKKCLKVPRAGSRKAIGVGRPDSMPVKPSGGPSACIDRLTAVGSEAGS